jgi:uncharacterized membrane protein YqjE
MAGQPMPFRNPAGHAGLLNNLLSLAGTLADFFETRLGLVARESKSALVHFAILGGALAAALILLLIGYLFLIASIVAEVAHGLRISWVWTSLMAAGLHFLLALACVVVARMQLKRPVFHESVNELKKDREWLKKLDKTSLTTN